MQPTYAFGVGISTIPISLENSDYTAFDAREHSVVMTGLTILSATATPTVIVTTLHSVFRFMTSFGAPIGL